MRKAHPDLIVVVPRGGSDLPTALRAVAHLRRCVLWLDDLARFAGPDGNRPPHWTWRLGRWGRVIVSTLRVGHAEDLPGLVQAWDLADKSRRPRTFVPSGLFSDADLERAAEVVGAGQDAGAAIADAPAHAFQPWIPRYPASSADQRAEETAMSARKAGLAAEIAKNNSENEQLKAENLALRDEFERLKARKAMLEEQLERRKQAMALAPPAGPTPPADARTTMPAPPTPA